MCLLRECDGARLTAMLVWGMCGECRACGWYTWFRFVSSANDLLWMSVVRGMRGVGGVCVCVWLGSEWVES